MFFLFLNHQFVFLLILLVSLQTAWIVIKRNAEYKPLQFLAFAFVYRIFEKLKAFEPPVSPTFTVSFYLKSLSPCLVCSWYRIRGTCTVFYRNFLFFNLSITGRRWRWWARPANGKKASPFSCSSFRLYCVVLCGTRCCSTLLNLKNQNLTTWSQ